MEQEHEGLPVAGYRAQPATNIELVNQNKRKEEETLRMLDLLSAFPNIDHHWLALGRADIEKGWMAVNRSIFKPGRASLPNETDLGE